MQYLLPALYDSMFALPTKKVTKGSFEFEARWRKAYPFLTVTRGRRRGAGPGPGRHRLYDGQGPAGRGLGRHRYAGRVRGPRRRRQGRPGDPVGRADRVGSGPQAAAAAGARLLLVVNDGPGKLLEYVGTDEGDYSAVPVVTVTARVGAALLARRPAGRLRLERAWACPTRRSSTTSSTRTRAGSRAELTYRPQANELATVDMVFHGTTGYEGGEFRWDYRPYRQYSFGFLQRAPDAGHPHRLRLRPARHGLGRGRRLRAADVAGLQR